VGGYKSGCLYNITVIGDLTQTLSKACTVDKLSPRVDDADDELFRDGCRFRHVYILAFDLILHFIN